MKALKTTTKIKKAKITFTLTLLLVFFSNLFGCGGKNSPPSDTKANSIDNGNQDSETINEWVRGLSGSLLISLIKEDILVDLDNGDKKTVWNEDYWSFVNPIRDGSGFIVVRASQDIYDSGDEILLLSESGDIIQPILSQEDIVYGAIPSHDGKLIAFRPNWSGRKITVYERASTEFIKTYSTNNLEDKINDFAWLPDGRLLVAVENSIFTTDPFIDEPPTLIKSFTGFYPTDLDASPNGEALVMSLVSEETQQFHIYKLNMDGSELKQLTYADLAEPGSTKDSQGGASWSPDGRYIAFRQPLSHESPVLGARVGECPKLYIMDADAFADFSNETSTDVIEYEILDKRGYQECIQNVVWTE